MAKVKTENPPELPLSSLDWVSLISLLGEARSALAYYDAKLEKMTNSQIDELVEKETWASSKGKNSKYIAEALKFAIHWSQSKPINNNLFFHLHAIVKKDGPNKGEIGQFRKKQNWVGPEGCSIKEAYFYPPEPEKISKLMKELNKYGRSKELDPLVQVAIFVAQFLMIHPFMDGNGRVIRTLIPILLWKKGLICKPALFLSPYFEKRRAAYMQKLFYISKKKHWEEWILFFLQGIIDQSN